MIPRLPSGFIPRQVYSPRLFSPTHQAFSFQGKISDLQALLRLDGKLNYWFRVITLGSGSKVTTVSGRLTPRSPSPPRLSLVQGSLWYRATLPVTLSSAQHTQTTQKNRSVHSCPAPGRRRSSRETREGLLRKIPIDLEASTANAPSSPASYGDTRRLVGPPQQPSECAR